MVHGVANLCLMYTSRIQTNTACLYLTEHAKVAFKAVTGAHLSVTGIIYRPAVSVLILSCKLIAHTHTHTADLAAAAAAAALTK